MTEQLHFSELWPHWPEPLAGLWVTGAVDGAGDDRRTGDRHPWGGDPQRSPGNASAGYGADMWKSSVITPFVVQLFFIVFGLPEPRTGR